MSDVKNKSSDKLEFQNSGYKGLYGGTMPEDLPMPDKGIKQIEREQECRKLKVNE
jgi:hypothetical protein